ncbi:MAG: response regulator [Deltaproteobacteria bacterium]|nr:response regulator [Deltaproteobacteria bacterium]
MSSKTLLFADDSATMRLIMEKTFLGEDFDIITVPSGQAAIEKARELSPDIIIADAGMTGVSGYDVCQTIRQDAGLSHTPLVIMSGISTPYDETRGKSVGATEHIKKPFDTTKLIDRVAELCANAVPAPAPAQTPAPAASATTSSVSTGVVPARPSRSSISAATKRDGVADMASTSSTLHAFPRPGLLDETVRPVQPVAVNAPPKASETQPSMSTTRSSIKMPVAEPEPIEIAEEEHASEIQVGTLAELAQMNAQGGKIPQEVREDAIELDRTPSRASEKSAPAKPVAESPIQKATASASARHLQSAASQAAKDVVAGVEGLTSEQAQAIMALTEDVVEKVVWEVVPDLAEAIIREKLDELLSK